jgi:hypothetical protein
MKFIILQNQEQFGPFDLDQLQAIVNEGHFQLTDYCWAEEWSEWKLLSAVVSRIPQALQNVIPGGANENFAEVNSEPVNKDEISDHTPAFPETEGTTDCSLKNITGSTLKAGMVVKNESQSVSCDFVTSLAVRGIFVKPNSKDEDLPVDTISSPEIAFHIAREGEVIGYYIFEDILSHLESGVLFPTDLFWKESVGEWRELSQV